MQGRHDGKEDPGVTIELRTVILTLLHNSERHKQFTCKNLDLIKQTVKDEVEAHSA
jgi:hypothetical protein